MENSNLNDADDALLKLIQELTMSGKMVLDELLCKQFKMLCKNSNENIKRSFYMIWSQLKKDHSEIRRSSVQLVNILFTRSALFRDLLLENMQEFIDLTLGINHNNPLPLPYQAANDLKCKTISFLRNWHNTFGKAYKKLTIVYNYLKNCKNINFDCVENNSYESSTRESERLAIIKQAKLTASSKEFNDILPEIKSTIVEIENCFKLILPNPEQFDIYNKNSSKSNDNQLTYSEDVFETAENTATNNHYRKHGLLADISINFNFDTNFKLHIDKTEDNADILSLFYEKSVLLQRKYLNVVKRLMKIFTKNGADSNIMKEILDLKVNIENILKKVDKIVIQNDLTTKKEESSDEDSENDFTEVPSLEIEETSNPSLKPSTSGFLPIKEDKWKILTDHKDAEFDPTHVAATLKRLDTNKANSSSSKTSPVPTCSSSSFIESKNTVENLKSKAPVIPYGIDLFHWGDTVKELPMKASPSQINWWVSGTEEEKVDKEAIASMKERVINFTGTFEPVKWKCRAPMSNGKLCFRMDRKKCPFHGPIIARDKTGRANGPGSSTTQSNSRLDKLEKNDSWRDPELEADISAAIGVNLAFDPKNKRKKLATNKSTLTDLKSLKNNTPYKRLEKKIFNTGAVKRVANALNVIDAKKIRDKFGNNFNYAHTK